MILLVICCNNKKLGIWLEIAAFVCLVAFLPTINAVSSYAYNVLLARSMGEYYMVAHSLVFTIASCCMIPAGLGQALAHATCGMSIVFKK